MKKIIYLLFLCCIVINIHTQPTNPIIKSFIVVNWTDEQLTYNDIQFSYISDAERNYSWGETLQEYSSKSILIDTSINSVIFSGEFSSPVLNQSTTQHIVHRSSGKNLQVSLIKTSISKEIIGLNICNDILTFGRIRHFIVANLSGYDITLNTVTHQDNSVVNFGNVISKYSFNVFPISTQSLNDDFVQGKPIRTYNITYNSNQTQQPLYYNSTNCTFGTDNQMVVGVEVSNSGVDTNKVVN